MLVVGRLQHDIMSCPLPWSDRCPLMSASSRVSLPVDVSIMCVYMCPPAHPHLEHSDGQPAGALSFGALFRAPAGPQLWLVVPSRRRAAGFWPPPHAPLFLCSLGSMGYTFNLYQALCYGLGAQKTFSLRLGYSPLD